MHVAVIRLLAKIYRMQRLRRLQEELGFSTPLKKAFTFTYRADFDNGLTENEFDHVFTGVYDGNIEPDADEVKDYTFMSVNEIEDSINLQPWRYTPWFVIAFPEVKKRMASFAPVVTTKL